MRNILVAYDGGEPAHRALETGIDLAKRFEASLGVVSVIPVRAGRTPIDPWDDKAVHDRQLAEAREIVARHGIAAEMFEPAGDPAKTIESIAEEATTTRSSSDREGSGRSTGSCRAACPSMSRRTPRQRSWSLADMDPASRLACPSRAPSPGASRASARVRRELRDAR